MTTTVSVRGIDQLKAFLTSLPANLRKLVVPTVAEYLIGDNSHGLRHLVNYKYVSRTSAYGQPFVSDKQRRYVMAMIGEGKITPGRSNRTGAMSAGWTYGLQGGGYGAKITNSVPGVGYVL